MPNELSSDFLTRMLAADNVDAIRDVCGAEHPASIAETLSEIDAVDIWRILHLLAVPQRAEIFAHFDLDLQEELATGETRREMALLIEEMDSDDRAELIRRLDAKVREEILPLVARAEREDIRRLVSFEEGTAGSVMNTDYAVLHPNVRVDQALVQIRQQAPSKETIYYIYVIDDQRRLVGFVSLRALIMARSNQHIGEIMQSDIVSVNVNDDQEEVARKIEKFDLIAIPVINELNVLVGIVTHDDAIDILRQEQQEDVEKFMAIGGHHSTREYVSTPVWRHFRNRAVWVLPLAFFGLISGLIIQHHETLLMEFTILAIFIPMLADTGGNTGSQSATLIVRALALQEIKPHDVFRVLFKEFRVAILLAVTLSIVAFGRVLFFGSGAELRGYSIGYVGLAISIALGLQVISSTLLGALLPLTAARFKFDPALVASPALTTFVDISGVFIFFTTTRWMLTI